MIDATLRDIHHPTQLLVANPAQQLELKRSLGLGLLTFYGLGIIIGAGVYVAIGEVIGRVGTLAVCSFAVAGVLAALIAMCYAELAARYPDAAGAAAYVREAFGSNLLSQLTGLAVVLVAIISAATIARGTAGYARAFVTFPEDVVAAAVVLVFTTIACLGVRDSVRAAAAMTIIELVGLMVVVSAGWAPVRDLTETALILLVPADLDAWIRVGAGAFLAFFAFTGFENLANMAEEAENARRTLPRAILLSLGISTVIYMAVALVVVAAVPLEEAAGSTAPLLAVMEHGGWNISNSFAALALVAIANGVLIQILMLARLFYGMARRSLLPIGLASVWNHVPVRATVAAGALVLISTIALPFEALLRLSTTLTLVIFALVSMSLRRLQQIAPCRDLDFTVPRWVPVAAAAGSIALIVAQFATG